MIQNNIKQQIFQKHISKQQKIEEMKNQCKNNHSLVDMSMTK